MTRTYRIVDLFAGIGGLRNGVVDAIEAHGDTAKVVFTSEIKKTAIATLKANHPNEKIDGDITKVSEKDVPFHDILLAGFPCQAFSYAGTRKGFGDSTRGTLFFDVARILQARKPDYFILENVEGLITHDFDPIAKKAGQAHGRTLATILDTLRNIGYKVEWNLLDASDFGVPQARKRVFIIGSLDTSPKFPAPSPKKAPVSLVLEKGHKETDKKVIDFTKILLKTYSLDHLKGKIIRDKRGGANNLHSWNFNYRGVTTAAEREMMELIGTHSRRISWAAIKGVPLREGLPLNAADIATFYTPPKNATIAAMLTRLTTMGYLIEDGVGEYRIMSGKLSFPIAHILDPTKPTPTLVATDSDRIGVIDGKAIRRLTFTEVKRLFGFKDTFIVPADLTYRQKFDLFGNSVVSTVAQKVTTELLYPKA